MHRGLIALLTTTLLLGLLATPCSADALADEGVHVRVPPAYARLDVDAAMAAAFAAQAPGSLPMASTPEAAVYVLGDQLAPEVALTVLRFALPDGQPVPTLKQLETNLMVANTEGPLAGMATVNGRRETLISGQPAIVVDVDAHQTLANGVKCMRLAYVVDDRNMVMAIWAARESTPARLAEWTDILATLRVERSGGTVNRMLLYGGMGLAFLLLLGLVVLRMRAPTSPAGRALSFGSGAVASAKGTPERGPSLFRASDGLPTYGGPGSGPSIGGGDPTPGQRSSDLPGLRSTLPR